MSSSTGKILKRLIIIAVWISVVALVWLWKQPSSAEHQQTDAQLKYRWFYLTGYGCNRNDVEKVKSLIDVGAAHGMNGIVLSSFRLDTITRWDEKDIALLKEVAAYCAEKRVELIPYYYIQFFPMHMFYKCCKNS